MVLADEGLEVRGELSGQPGVQVLTPEHRIRASGQGARQGRGRGEAAQRLSPVELRGLQRLSLEPGDVVAEGGRPTAGRAPTGANLLVGGEELLEEEPEAPAIHDEVVQRPEDSPRALLRADDRQAQQRWRAQVEATSTVLGDERLEAASLLGFIHSAPVVLLPGERGFRVDPLERLGGALGDEGRAQQGLTLDDGFPGATEGGHVHGAAEGPRQLRDVDAGARGREGVEEHALLQGRQRIEVVRQRPHWQHAVEHRLGQPCQGEVGGREAAGVVGASLVDEPPQRVQAPLRQGLNGLFPVRGLAVRPHQGQPALEDVAVDLQEVGERRIGSAQGAQGLARRGEGIQHRAVTTGLVELAQVVEEHLRMRQRAQIPRMLLVHQVAQQAVAQALARKAPQRVPHRAQPVTQAGGARDIQRHGIQGGEPAHGARQVHVVGERLATVALQFHAQARLAHPVREAVGHRRQQHVVDVRPPGRRSLLQQQPRLGLVQGDFHRARGGHGSGTARAIPGNGGNLESPLFEPPGPLPCDFLGAREVAQLRGPGLEGRGPGRQRHRAALSRLHIRRAEVLQERAPGDAIHAQVVHRQQEP